MNVVVECVDRLRTTAGSHRRIFVVETMGRHAGWLALEGGESSGAYIILIPEYDFSMERVNELLLEGRTSVRVTRSLSWQRGRSRPEGLSSCGMIGSTASDTMRLGAWATMLRKRFNVVSGSRPAA
jgi:6-phosphofructokinase 1